MSWLSHFTGWIGEKKNTILPVVTGLAGFAAGMIPGIGGAVSRQIDKWGNKLSGATEALDKLGGQDNNPAAPTSPAVTAVQAPELPSTLPTGEAVGSPKRTPEGSGPNTALLVGGGILAALLFGGKRR